MKYVPIIVLTLVFTACATGGDKNMEENTSGSIEEGAEVDAVFELKSLIKERSMTKDDLEKNGFIPLNQLQAESTEPAEGGKFPGENGAEKDESNVNVFANASEPREASILTDLACSDIISDLRSFTSTKNQTILMRNIDIGLLFFTAEYKGAYLFIAPSSLFMLSPLTKDKVTRMKCLDDGEYFDVITNLNAMK